MLKGVSRNVIIVKTKADSRFEVVYFIVKKGVINDRAEIVKEANRIVSQSGMSGRPAGLWKQVKLTLPGVCIGAALASALWLVGILLI